jgi:hypothetical protein
MRLEKEKDEIVIRIKEGTLDPDLLQDFIEYIESKSIVSNSQATEEDIDNISTEMKNEWWKENKDRYIK